MTFWEVLLENIAIATRVNANVCHMLSEQGATNVNQIIGRLPVERDVSLASVTLLVPTQISAIL